MTDSTEIYGADHSVAETLAIEERLRANGYARLPEVLRLGGEFDFLGRTVEEVIAEMKQYLRHQRSVELAGATILAAIGEFAVKAQAADAMAALLQSDR